MVQACCPKARRDLLYATSGKDTFLLMVYVNSILKFLPSLTECERLCLYVFTVANCYLGVTLYDKVFIRFIDEAKCLQIAE